MARVCLVTTSPLIVNFFLVPHLLRLRESHAVTLVVNAEEPTELKPLPGVEVVSIPILRRIAPLHDAHALWQLRRLFASREFDLVHSYSPKAGLLAMLAARLSRVRVRNHTFTGQVWVTRKGPMRELLRWADRVTAGVATHVLADSASQLHFLVEEGIVAAGKCRVLGAGSITGVDLQRFRPDEGARHECRARLGIGEDAKVILFLGRLAADKGVIDLATAFARVRKSQPDAVLLVVGPDEEDMKPRMLEAAAAASSGIVFAGYTHAPERFTASADVLCLPSYREGFGSVIIEAAACGLPAVSTRIYGVTDAVVENETGLLCAPGDVDDLACKLASVLADDEYRRRLAEAARRRAAAEFSQDRVVGEMLRFYGQVLGA